MLKQITTALLAAATALTPLSAAYAQREGRGYVREEGVERIPRGPEIRQTDRRQWERPAAPRSDAPRGDGPRADDRPRGDWRQDRSRTDTPPPAPPRGDWRQDRPRSDAPRADAPPRGDWRQDRPRGDAPRSPREEWGRPGGAYDRNRDGQPDRRWDRNRDGSVDRGWDRNGNGRVDRQWDRNRDGNLDRRWDRNDDNRFDRRWDRDRDGRHDRYDRHVDRRDWNRGWRSDRRYNWYGHRNQYRDHYRLGRYHAPYYGHRYNRFSIGFSIGAPFYSSRYWINDPWRYRLPDVYGPYRWVRYYDDVLLVDIYSGEVVDVIYNFFW